jgi:chemotaxis protein MotB
MQHPHEEKPEGAPEWMVSYADMITIIMAFFVIMFAIASGEAAKGKKAQQSAIESFQYRFGPQWKPFMSWGLSPGNSRLPGGGKGLGSPAPTPAVGDPGGTVHVPKKEKQRIRVSGQGDLLSIGKPLNFVQATTELAPGQSETIQSIADELAGKQPQVVIEATVSNQPLPRNGLFRDRWDLGYARCRRAAEIFTSLKVRPVDPERLRLSVIPATADEDKGEPTSEVNAAVKVYQSTKLPAR